MHHFPFHITDIDHATGKLTPEEFGTVVRLWMALLKSEKNLPNDWEELAFLTGARSKKEKEILKVVVKRYFVVSDDSETLKSAFCEKIIEGYRASGVQSRYANLGRHWDKVNEGVPKPSFEQFTVNPAAWFEEDTGRIRKVTGRNPLVLVSESDGFPNPLPLGSQPITKNQEPITIGTPVVPKGTDTMEAFAEAIYGLYPLKVGKTKALAAIVKVLKAGAITELDLQAKVRAYAEATAKWAKEDRTFIPHPSTWFNRGSYLDDPTTWIREPAGPQKKERGAAGPVAAPVLQLTEEPEGYERAMVALWGVNWRATYAAWALMPPADQRQVRAWLVREKKEGGAEMTKAEIGMTNGLSPEVRGGLGSAWCQVSEGLLAQVWEVIEPLTSGGERFQVEVGPEIVDFGKYAEGWEIVAHSHKGATWVGSCMSREKLTKLLMQMVGGTRCAEETGAG